MSISPPSLTPSLRLSPLTRVRSLITSPSLHSSIDILLVSLLLTAARTSLSYLASAAYDALTVTARIEQHDPAYDWVMAWLAAPERSRGARNWEVDTRMLGGRGGKGAGWTVETGLMLLPNFHHARWLSFQGTLLRVVRDQNNSVPGNPSESVTITTLSRSPIPLLHLLTSSHAHHAAQTSSLLVIHTPTRSLSGWTRRAARPPRSMGSVVLDRNVKEGLRNDVREFLEREGWYVERGIPHRRGYLLYGVPGSGKTSIITAIAGNLGLDLYVISLAQKGLDDANLSELIGSCNPGSAILMEDIDCAFASRSAVEQEEDLEASMAAVTVQRPAMSASGVTLSGLLNCLDGVAAQEGSIFFATTNHVDVLDPALSRPGRFDVWVEFRNSTKAQAHDLFLNFFPEHKVQPTDPLASRLEKHNLPQNDRRLQLADAFAAAVPEEKYSVAALQGFLMGFKGQPERAVEAFPMWDETKHKSGSSHDAPQPVSTPGM